LTKPIGWRANSLKLPNFVKIYASPLLFPGLQCVSFLLLNLTFTG
jgi:hypothetical protein